MGTEQEGTNAFRIDIFSRQQGLVGIKMEEACLKLIFTKQKQATSLIRLVSFQHHKVSKIIHRMLAPEQNLEDIQKAPSFTDEEAKSSLELSLLPVSWVGNVVTPLDPCQVVREPRQVPFSCGQVLVDVPPEETLGYCLTGQGPRE